MLSALARLWRPINVSTFADQDKARAQLQLLNKKDCPVLSDSLLIKATNLQIIPPSPVGFALACLR